MKKIFALLLVFTTLFVSCKNDDDNASKNVTVAFSFSHNWDNTEVTSSNFNTLEYTNENGEVLNIARLRHLTSRYELINSNGVSFPLTGYNFVDLSDASTYMLQTNELIPTGTYTLKMVWGFNEEDNVDGAYLDLNSVSWNWPAMLGGGYHFMQFDGMYDIDTASPQPFNYHNGTARVSMGVFEQNFVNLEFSSPITITDDANIEIKMNIAEWFKNPNTWDLNVYNTPLMPNYDAQKMMQQNVVSVFSIGSITQ